MLLNKQKNLLHLQTIKTKSLREKNMRSLIFALSLALLLNSCSNKSSSNSCYYDDGSKKPTVVLVPMLDSTSYDAPWSLSEEFSCGVKSRLEKKSDFYFMQDVNFDLSLKENPFNCNLSWVKKNFKPAEFVVFIELVEHDNVPLVKSVKDPESIPAFRKNASNLNMATRLRILDIRKDEPVVVLQEMLKNSCYMANTVDNPDYNVAVWGTESYKNTPLEAAHRELIEALEKRIYEYINLAKTR